MMKFKKQLLLFGILKMTTEGEEFYANKHETAISSSSELANVSGGRYKRKTRKNKFKG